MRKSTTSDTVGSEYASTNSWRYSLPASQPLIKSRTGVRAFKAESGVRRVTERRAKVQNKMNLLTFAHLTDFGKLSQYMSLYK